MLPDYAELHCLTNFSFLRGASHPEELAARAAKLGYSALAVTDECSLAGVVRAHVAAKEQGLKLIVGAEFRLADGPKLVLLATDREAYGNLSQLITTARRRSRKGSYRLDWDDLATSVPGCLILLIPPDGPSSNLPSPLGRGAGVRNPWAENICRRSPNERSQRSTEDDQGQATSDVPSADDDGGWDKFVGGFRRLSTCVTRARLTPRNRASAARLSNLPVSNSDW